MTVRLRQVALVAADLDPTVSMLCGAFDLSVCFKDPGVGEFGLHNALMRVGDDFLEVVSPTRAGTTAGRQLERRGGDGGYMVIVQAESFEELTRLRERLGELGVRVVWRHDAAKIAGTHLHPRDVGGAILSIDAAYEPQAWAWGGPTWQSAATGTMVSGIAGVTISADDPAAMCARWADILDAPTTDNTVHLGGDTFVKFAAVNVRGEGVDQVHLRSGNASNRRVLVAGCRFTVS